MIALPAGALTEMVGRYVCEKTGAKLVPGMYQAFMVVNDQNDLVGAATFTNQRGTVDIEMSGASETPFAWRPHVCKAILGYAFDQLGCVRISCITVKGNRKARTFLEGLGFQLEGNLRLGYDGRRDALIYGLLRSECRFLTDERESHVEEGRPDSPSSAGPGSDGGGPGKDECRVGDSASEPEPD